MFLNCETEKNPTKSIDEKTECFFFPLQVGNQWIYEIKIHNISTQIDTETIVEKANYFGSAYYRFNQNPLIHSDLWITEKDSAVYFINTKDSSEHILFDFTAKPGDSWAMPERFDCEVGDSIILLSDTTTLITEYSTFYNCYHFKHKSFCMDGGMVESWFVKDVGFVKNIYETYFGYAEMTLKEVNIFDD